MPPCFSAPNSPAERAAVDEGRRRCSRPPPRLRETLRRVHCPREVRAGVSGGAEMPEWFSNFSLHP